MFFAISFLAPSCRLIRDHPSVPFATESSYTIHLQVKNKKDRIKKVHSTCLGIQQYDAWTEKDNLEKEVLVIVEYKKLSSVICNKLLLKLYDIPGVRIKEVDSRGKNTELAECGPNLADTEWDKMPANYFPFTNN